MHSSSRITAANFFGTLSLTLSIILAMLALIAGPALANNGNGNGSGGDPDVCDPYDSGKIDVPGDQQSVTVTAPEGQLISGYCVKAGSEKSGAGTEWVPVDPPQASVVISHSSGKDVSHYAVEYVDIPDPEPTVALSTACDDTQPTATVTIDNDGDETFEVEVFIDNVSQGTFGATETFEGDAESVLRVEWGEDSSDEVTFEDCTDDEPLSSTAAFTTGTECEVGLPAVTYDATVSETADDPIDEITLTVTDANGVDRAEVILTESAAGNLPLPTDFEGETVNVSWDFDDTTTQQTLAENCAEVQGIVEEPDEEPAVDDKSEEEPAALPTTEVKGEQVASGGELPNTGMEHVIMLLLASALFALGGSFLLVSDRRRTVIG